MGYREEYQFWLEDAYFDAYTKKELEAIAGIKVEAFSKVKEFYQ